MAKIGIIGGSGLDDPQWIKKISEQDVETPYGKASSPLTVGLMGDREVIFLSRHGRKHQYSPSEVNYRANVYALKEQGVSHIIATTACGSLRQEIGRGHFVVVDQFIDFTRLRKNTYYESFAEETVHTAMSAPFDEGLRKALVDSASTLGLEVHRTGTVITIEGPRFSTKAESNMFRIWGADVINMSIATEVILANELKIPYAAVAMSTDYDCWKEDEEPVTWEEIVKVFGQNTENVKKILANAVVKIS